MKLWLPGLLSPVLLTGRLMLSGHFPSPDQQSIYDIRLPALLLEEFAGASP